MLVEMEKHIDLAGGASAAPTILWLYFVGFTIYRRGRPWSTLKPPFCSIMLVKSIPVINENEV